jgi:glutamate decarboxylase
MLSQPADMQESIPRGVRRPSIVELAADPHHNLSSPPQSSSSHTLAFGSRYSYRVSELPKYELPEESTDPRIAYRVVSDEMALDGNPTLNLASFVTTWMDPEALRLMKDTVGKNYADCNIYPQTIEIQNRCISILSKLYNSPSETEPTGTCCIGSSEALMLGGLAMKRAWVNRRKEKGLPHDKPNMIMTSAVQVAWKKMCCYFDIEPRYVPLTKERYVLDIDQAIDLCDENTIGVVAVLGSTYTGHYEDVKGLSDRLTTLNEEKGWSIGIHVDAASGGFVAPFLDPDLEWDFRLPLVKSINISGHKYGGVYPGVGWALWREKSDLPQELIFDLHYLGGVEQTFTLNFSRPASHMIAQYYNFIRLGRKGYKTIMEHCRMNANYLTERLIEIGKFDILSDDKSIPLVAFKLKDEVKGYTVYDISSKLRESGWIVPAYTLAENAEDVPILRVVIRESFSQDLAELLIRSMVQALKFLEETAAKVSLLENTKSDEAKKERVNRIALRFITAMKDSVGRAGESVC